MRENFEHKIENLKHQVIKMGAVVEEVISMSVESLKNQDVELAKRVNEEDDKIDQLEIDIETDCMNILALEQPLAKDLRTVATALKIITDLERIGDHAVNISKVTMEIGHEKLIKPLVDIPKMAKISQEMIKLSLDAFVREDVELAEKVAEMDHEVDELYSGIVDEVIGLISNNKEFAKQGTKLMFVGRYLERIADHTTNICERIIYMVTGVMKEIN